MKLDDVWSLGAEILQHSGPTTSADFHRRLTEEVEERYPGVRLDDPSDGETPADLIQAVTDRYF